MFAPPEAIAHSLADACARADRALAQEQAVRGLDAMKETDLHAVLADGLAGAGWGVLREVVYPGDAAVTDTERDRCDLVLLPQPGDRLADPVRSARLIDEASETLFAPVAEAMETRRVEGAVNPADAVWVEVKAVAQHRYRQGVPGPNPGYTSALIRGPGADAAKLMADGVICNACLAVVLFTESEPVARHDLLAMTHALLDRQLPVASPAVECVPLTDRAGNACAAVAVVPLRSLGLDA